MTTRWSACAAWSVSALLAVVLGVSGQERTPPTFKSGAVAVIVDVSVLDAGRHPVRGLTAADFSITEDGQPQKIVTFSAIDAPQRGKEEQLPVWWQEAPADVTSNHVPPDGRLVVVVLDDLLPMAPGDSPRAKQLATALVDGLGPSDLAAIVFLSGRHPAVNFTLDHARLRTALSRYEPRWSRDFDEHGPRRELPERGTYAARFWTIYRTATTSIHNLVEALGNIQGRRKALLWITAGMPVQLNDIAGDPLTEEWNEIFHAAARSNVSIYPMDPGGLRGVAIRLDQSRPDWVRDTPGVLPDQLEGYYNVRLLEDVANNTGGIAVVGSNDPGPGLSRVLEETGTYYVIGYQPPSVSGKSQRHRVEVRVARPHLTVRSRKEYWSLPTSESVSPLKTALASMTPLGDIGLTAAVAPFLGTTATSCDIAIVLGVNEPSTARPKVTTETVELVVNAYDASGKAAGSVTTHVQVGLPAGGENVQYELLTPIRLKPGHYELRVGVATNFDPKVGSLTCDVEVPDFVQDPLSLSGLVLSTDPAEFAAPRQALSSFLSVIPTARRVFAKTDRVDVVFRVYQGRKDPVRSVPLQILVRAANGTTEFEQQETLDSGRFGRGRTTEYRLRLPLGRLPSGPHLLSIDAGTGKDVVQRQVRFETR